MYKHSLTHIITECKGNTSSRKGSEKKTRAVQKKVAGSIAFGLAEKITPEERMPVLELIDSSHSLKHQAIDSEAEGECCVCVG